VYPRSRQLNPYADDTNRSMPRAALPLLSLSTTHMKAVALARFVRGSKPCLGGAASLRDAGAGHHRGDCCCACAGQPTALAGAWYLSSAETPTNAAAASRQVLVAGEVGVGKSMLISTLTNTLPGGATLTEPQRPSTPGAFVALGCGSAHTHPEARAKARGRLSRDGVLGSGDRSPNATTTQSVGDSHLLTPAGGVQFRNREFSGLC
jgi:hypothetical protein